MRAIKDQIGMDKVVSMLRSSEELDINSEGDKVRRVRPLVPTKGKDSFDRSVYVKGFPEETPILQAELEKFFGQFGNIASVRMRRDMNVKEKKKPFKGSVFVEFVHFEEMKSFVEKGESENVEERPQFQGQELKVMSKDAYCQMKVTEKGLDPSSVQRGHTGGASTSTTQDSRGQQRTVRFNAFRELEREARGLPTLLDEDPLAAKVPKKSRAEEAEERKKQAKENRSKPLDFEFNNVKLSTNPEGTIIESMLTFPEKSVLSFKGAGEGGNWRDLKETLLSIHPTSFVEFPNGAVEGAVGFKSTLDDEKLAEIVNRGITVGGQVVEWKREGEERARKFYLDRANFRAKFLIDQREESEAEGRAFNGSSTSQYHQNGRGGHRGGGRGGARGGGGRGRGGHRGQRGGRDNKRKRDDVSVKGDAGDAPPEISSSKKPKTEVQSEAS